MRRSLFTFGSVAHTVPSPLTATPNGAAPNELAWWRVKTPRSSRVTLGVRASANHTAPAGATASRPSLASGMDSVNAVMAPSGEMRATARAGLSVNHAYPSASTASPSGSTFSFPLGSRSLPPFRSTPMASENSIVNQTAPWGLTATAAGMSVVLSIRYSVKPGGDHGPRRHINAAPAIATRVAMTTRMRHRPLHAAFRRAVVAVTLTVEGLRPGGPPSPGHGRREAGSTAPAG